MAWQSLTDKQWDLIKEHFPKRPFNKKGGQPPADDRKCFEGILWILWTGAPWSELPEKYGTKSAANKRLRDWAENDVLLNLWRALLNQLTEQQKVKWDECFIDECQNVSRVLRHFYEKFRFQQEALHPPPTPAVGG